MSLPSDRTLIFIHLYKTAGTTLNRIIEWEYDVRRVCNVEPNFWRWSYQRIMRWPPSRLARMDVFKGHMPFGLHRLIPRPATYITVLRKPVERAVSDYYWARSFKAHRHHRAALELTLEDYFVHKHDHNWQTRILAGPSSTDQLLPDECNADTLSTAKANLDRYFSVVGLTERFDETLALLKIAFGWNIKRYRKFRVTKGRVPTERVPASTREMIRAYEQYDLALYDYAESLFEKAIAERREAVEAELQAIRGAKEMTPLEARYYFAASIARAAVCRIQAVV